MSEDIITLGNAFEPPVVSIETSQDVYSCIKTDEFDVATFNGLLMALITYLDTHDIEYNNGGLPWAELVKSV